MRLKYAANVLPIRVMCSGRISPHFILKAFQEGADGVLVAGCHIGECHYGKGNFITAKRVAVMRELIQFIGLSPKRLRLEWIATSEGNKFAQVVSDFTEEITQLGPSSLRPKKIAKFDTGKKMEGSLEAHQ
ncbi:MAG: hydrogenase iron-sulfur subunit [Deltaproteobacteria bacterium]|jgi:F420-non-reducing hydrogenase iron-sulfur subunit|nr:hydrogenase iron-sulfur subunit [Deltaproteobacteria bacterium]